jgi:hypothetical protein
MAEILFKELSFKVIGCAVEVHRVLGPGFLEAVYLNAPAQALNYLTATGPRLALLINFGAGSLQSQRVVR